MDRRASSKTSSRTSPREQARRGAAAGGPGRPRAWARGAALLAAGALAGGWTLAPTPARAGDFEDGFEDQLGRIAAVSVVRFGAFLIQGAFQAPRGPQVPAVYQPAPSPDPYRPPSYPVYPAYPSVPAPVPPHTHPHAHAVPPHEHWGAPTAPQPSGTPAVYGAPPPSLWAEPDEGDEAPCPHHTAAPYGEHVVYERYERTVTPPPRAAPAPGSRYLAY